MGRGGFGGKCEDQTCSRIDGVKAKSQWFERRFEREVGDSPYFRSQNRKGEKMEGACLTTKEENISIFCC